MPGGPPGLLGWAFGPRSFMKKRGLWGQVGDRACDVKGGADASSAADAPVGLRLKAGRGASRGPGVRPTGHARYFTVKSTEAMWFSHANCSLPLLPPKSVSVYFRFSIGAGGLLI